MTKALNLRLWRNVGRRVQQLMGAGKTKDEARALAREERKAQLAESASRATAEKAAREKRAMHCQICARDILADEGRIAHHGYQRPGVGWQTASCPGAMELPYEASNAAVTAFAKQLRVAVKNLRAVRAQAQAEEFPIRVSWEGARTTESAPVSRATFATDIEKVPLWARRSRGSTFDEIKAKDLARRDFEIRMAADHQRAMEHRARAWPGKTHEFTGEGWKRMEKPDA